MNAESKSKFEASVRFRVPRALLARLQRIADKRCKLVSEVSREAVVQYLDGEEDKESGGAKAAANGEEKAA